MTSSLRSCSVGALGGLLLLPALCLAYGGRVTYPDGTPASGANVRIIGTASGDDTRVCDGNGHFEFAQLPAAGGQIRITAPDGKQYANMVIPAKLFETGDITVILLRK